MKKVYVLYGKHDCGKTESIKRLIKLLKEDGYTVVNQDKRSPYDTWVTLFDHDGKLVGITSRGDTKEDLEADFIHFTDCERFVCAARTSGGTHDAVRELTTEENIFWLWKSAFDAVDLDETTVKCIRNSINRQTAEMMKFIFEK